MAIEDTTAEHFTLLPRDLVFFIDETGHEEFADAAHPVFGYGGCAVMGADYDGVIRQPWLKMKREHFGGEHVLMHASRLRKASRRRREALKGFFSGNDFYRFAAMQNISTALAGELTTYKTAAITLMKRFEAVSRWCPMDRIVVVFESCRRLNSVAEQFFPLLGISEETPTGLVSVPIRWLRMNKSEGELGLEVADFVMHAAGVQVRERRKGSEGFHSEFEAVFHSVDRRLVSYIDIDTATHTPPKASP